MSSRIITNYKGRPSRPAQLDEVEPTAKNYRHDYVSEPSANGWACPVPSHQRGFAG